MTETRDRDTSDEDGQAGSSSGTQLGTNSGGNVQAPETPPTKTSTHITPYASVTDLTPSKYLFFWNDTVKPPENWVPMKTAPHNLTLFLDALREWCETYNITLFQVPTEGDGSIHATPSADLRTS